MKHHFNRRMSLYVDVPLLFVFLALIYLLRHALLDELLFPIAKQLGTLTGGTVGGTIFLNVCSDLISAVLIALVAWIFFKYLMRARLSGDYAAYQVDGNTQIPYGRATIYFSPLSLGFGGVPVKLRLEHGDMILEGSGLIVNNNILVGHYTETGKPERRRCGSFFYRLDGNGQSWQGLFLYISPDTEETISGNGRWIRD